MASKKAIEMRRRKEAQNQDARLKRLEVILLLIAKELKIDTDALLKSLEENPSLEPAMVLKPKGKTPAEKKREKQSEEESAAEALVETNGEPEEAE